MTQWENRFDADGTLERIDVDFTSDSAGADFFPSLAPVQLAVRNIIGDSMYRTNAGAFTTVLDSDVRRFPFNFQYGLTDRITLTASIPLLMDYRDLTATLAAGGVVLVQAVAGGGLGRWNRGPAAP